MKRYVLSRNYEEMAEPHLADITAWREQGFSAKQIASMLGVSAPTFAIWMKKYPDLYDAWERGQVTIALKLEEAALREAFGYEYVEIDEVTLEDRDGNVYGRKTTKHTRRRHPDSKILLKALEAIHPDKWGKSVAIEDREIKILLDEGLKEYAE